MRLVIAPGPAVHWLLRSHDTLSKFSAIASRMCDRRNREVKHKYVSPLLRTFFVVSAVVPVYRGSNRFENVCVTEHHNANKLQFVST